MGGCTSKRNELVIEEMGEDLEKFRCFHSRDELNIANACVAVDLG